MADDTITRAHLAEAVYQEVGLSRNESAELVEAVLNEMSEALTRGETVKISSFGSFFVRLKGQRIGRNPKTGHKTTSQVLICISADSRAEVDDLVSKAESAGGVIDPSPQDDYDFMYGRSFEDLDGHLWGVNWMDFEAVAKDTAAPAA